ncbi:hypothetical protein VDG1235_2930 [Verrucomicrobiia bacterium DG1235]|nr:hypothetical protein VDG1235_2930 [Verrucomicrobiae bacterium DG1235]
MKCLFLSRNFHIGKYYGNFYLSLLLAIKLLFSQFEQNQTSVSGSNQST